MARIVIKIGSNILTEASGGLSYRRIRAIAGDVSGVYDMGHEVVIVSSGAVAAGMKKLGLGGKPKEIRLKQAAAAVGQSSLMRAYERSFENLGKKVAQALLTREDFSDRVRYLNSKNTLITLLSYGIIPVINENDTVATDEIKFGDNDQLAALVSGLIDAERLIILSDVDGLYDSDPKKNVDAKMISSVDAVTPDIISAAGGAGSAVGTGGMYSKILAARKALSHGIKVNIISGRKKGLIASLITGVHSGTEFRPSVKKISSRKGWIAYAIKPRGSLTIDDGAVRAVRKSGKSLLPAGVVGIDGTFDTGDAVNCVDLKGNKIAKGIVNYSAADIGKIKGKKTSEIERILGYKYSDEIIHRDNLVVVS
ncbi:MAG: glutamate 5-kinase [Nitrospirae bacterium]|nr:glutamate 5-kinase [Nitrospirota bacterium]